MEDQWEEHFEARYDFFQNHCSIYKGILDYHLQLHLHKGRSPILDTGAGTGNLTLKLAEAGMNVTAIDNSAKAIEILGKKCRGHDNITVREMDVQELKFGNGSYVGVSSMLVIPLVKDNQKYLEQVYRVLRKDGLFTITAWALAAADVDRVNKLWEEDLRKRGILPKFQKEWDAITKTDYAYVETIKKNALTKAQLREQLEKIGFRDIEFQRDNPLNEFGYSCVCRK